nr:hypothetical protein [Tanacetum cinerariifolium]
MLKNEVQGRDNILVILKQKLNQAEKERDDLKLKFDKIQTSSKNLTELLARQTNNKLGLGYFSSESDSKSLSPSCPSDRLQPSGRYNAFPSPITGNFMPLKPDLPVEAPILAATPKPTSPKTNSSGKRKNRKTCFVCRSVDHLIKDCNFHAKPKPQPTPRNYAHRGYTKQNASFTQKHPQKHIVPTAVLTKSKPVSVTAVRPVSTAVPKIMMTRPKHAHSIDTKFKSTFRRHITRSLSPKTSNSPPKVTAAKASVGTCPICLTFKSLIVDMLPLEVTPRVDETSLILNTFITGLENQLSLKVKVIRSDNGTEFKNSNLNQFCRIKGIKREFSVPRTPQQNGIVERKNRTLIEAARTMLADSLLPIPFWAEAVNIACYVQNSVLVTKPYNKTPYELLHGRTPSIGFMRPFGCLVTILNTLEPLGKFKGNVDEGFLVGYSINSKAFRVFNSRTHIVQETLHVNFMENKPNIAGIGPTWLFDIDSLTRTMNYQPVTTGNQSNPSAGFQGKFDEEKAREEANQQYMLFPVWSTGSSNPQNKEGDAAFDGKEHDAKKPESAVNLSPSSGALSGEQDDMTKKKDKGKSLGEYFTGNRDLNVDFEDYFVDSSNDVSAAGPIVPTAGQNYSNSTNPFSAVGPSNTNTSPTHEISLLKVASQVYDNSDMLEMEDIGYSDHENVGAEADFNNLETSIIVSPIPTTRTHKAHSKSQIIEEPKRVHHALKDPSWIKAMQEELLQFKMQKVWILDDLPHGKRAIGTKWVYRNKKDERGIIVRNKARLVTQGHTQEEGIDYEKVFAPVARIEAIRLFLVYSSFMGFMVYQMDVKQKKDGIFISQDKYVAKILKKFGLTEGKSASTPIDIEKPLLKDPDGEDVDVHIYRSMIGSLMYLTSLRPDIMFTKIYTGGCQFLGCRLISWQYKKQTVVATSSTETKYAAGANYCVQVLWIQN